MRATRSLILGQVCTNGTRVFIPTRLQAAFEAKISERVARIRAGAKVGLWLTQIARPDAGHALADFGFERRLQSGRDK
jgi:hypothetical protein